MPKIKPPERPEPIEMDPISARTIKKKDAAGKPYYTRPDGRAYWQARKNDEPERPTVWTGWATRKEAFVALAALLAGGMLATRASSRVVRVETVTDLLNAWVVHVAKQVADGHIQANTEQNYRSACSTMLFHLGEIRCDRLGVVELEHYRDTRLLDNRKRNAGFGRDGSGWTTVAGEFKTLRLAWSWGRPRGYVPDRDLPRVIVKDSGPTYSRETPDMEGIAKALDVLIGPDRLALLFLATTGGRDGEVEASRCWDLDLKTGKLKLDGKTGVRYAPILGTELFDVLKARVADSNDPGAPMLFWPDRSEHPLTRLGRIRRILHRAAVAVGIPKFPPHGLRRYNVNLLINACVPIPTAAAIMGHSPSVMMRYYAQATAMNQADGFAKAKMGVFTVKGGKVVQGPWKRAAGAESSSGDDDPDDHGGATDRVTVPGTTPKTGR